MKRLIRIGAIVAGLLIVVALALPFVIDPNSFRPALEAQLSAALARPVKLGDLKLSIFSGAVTAADLSIAEDPAYGKAPFVEAKSIKIGIELLPLLLSKKLNVTRLVIEEPRVTLLESASGDWNFSSLGTAKAPAPKPAEPAPAGKSLDLSVKLIQIANGRISVGRTAAKYRPLVLDKVNAEVRDFAAATAFPFSFRADVAGGGDLKLDGTVGPLNDRDASLTPLTATVKIAKFDLAGSGWTQAVPGMGGLISLDGSAKSDGKTANLQGKVTAEKLKLAQQATPAPHAVELDFALDHRLADRAGRLHKGAIHIGQAVANLTGTYKAQGNSTALAMALAGEKMPVPELAALLPALGVALPNGSTFQGGTANVKLSMEGLAERLVTTGTLSLDNTTLAGFDLGKRMAVVEMLAGMPSSPTTVIQTLAGNVRMGPEGATAESLQLVVPAIGDLAGSGTISPSNSLDFRMTAKVHTSGLAAAVADRPIPFLVQGTCLDPVFRPDMQAVKETVKKEGIKAATGFLKGLFEGKK